MHGTDERFSTAQAKITPKYDPKAPQTSLAESAFTRRRELFVGRLAVCSYTQTCSSALASLQCAMLGCCVSSCCCKGTRRKRLAGHCGPKACCVRSHVHETELTFNKHRGSGMLQEQQASLISLARLYSCCCADDWLLRGHHRRADHRQGRHRPARPGDQPAARRDQGVS